MKQWLSRQLESHQQSPWGPSNATAPCLWGAHKGNHTDSGSAQDQSRPVKGHPVLSFL